MNIIREFYQSLATEEERAAYQAAIRMNSKDRSEYLRDVFGVKATEAIIQEFAQATRKELLGIAEEVAQEIAQKVRRTFWEKVGYFFSFKWLG